MIVPSTRLFTAGEVETGAYLNSAVTNLGNFFLGKPIANLWQASAQSIPNAAYTAVTFDSELIDRDNAHSTTSNTDRFTAQTAGWYYLSGAIQYTGNVTGQRRALWQVNGAAPTGGGGFFNTASTLLAVTCTVNAPNLLQYLNVGDYVQLQAYQNSGAALALVATGGVFSSMQAIWVST